MKVMTHHDWFDDDVESVTMEGHEDVRQIDFRSGAECFLISKEDAIALAKEFGLVVYESNSAL